MKDFPVSIDEMTLDFDLKKSQEQAVQDTAKKQGLTPEQVKQMQEQQAKAEQYNANIKAINEKLKAATAATQANPPNYDAAIASLNEASQMAPNEDLVWFRLGGVYLDSAKAQTDPAEKTKRYTEAYNDLQKAIELKKNAMKSAPAGNAQGAAQGGKPPAQGGASDDARMDSACGAAAFTSSCIETK